MNPIQKTAQVTMMLVKKRDTTITVRMPAELKSALESEAQAFGHRNGFSCSLNDYVIMRLTGTVKEGE